MIRGLLPVTTQCQHPFVSDTTWRGPYRWRVTEDRTIIDANARWLRENREFFDLSAEALAERTREVARELGDEIKISQQLVSKFENGHGKSTQRWLGYVQIALLELARKRGLSDEALWRLQLSPAQERFFEDQRKRRKLNNPFAELAEKEDYSNPMLGEPLDDEEIELLERFRLLGFTERRAVLQLATTLTEAAGTLPPSKRPVSRTVHQKGPRYSPKQ